MPDPPALLPIIRWTNMLFHAQVQSLAIGCHVWRVWYYRVQINRDNDDYFTVSLMGKS